MAAAALFLVSNKAGRGAEFEWNIFREMYFRLDRVSEPLAVPGDWIRIWHLGNRCESLLESSRYLGFEDLMGNWNWRRWRLDRENEKHHRETYGHRTREFSSSKDKWLDYVRDQNRFRRRDPILDCWASEVDIVDAAAAAAAAVVVVVEAVVVAAAAVAAAAAVEFESVSGSWFVDRWWPTREAAVAAEEWCYPTGTGADAAGVAGAGD